MKPARPTIRPTKMGLVTAVGLLFGTSMMGCGPEGLRFGRSSRSSSPGEAQATPAPSSSKVSKPAVVTEAKAPPNRPAANEQVDAEAAPLHERIQKYVGRFPGDDLERKAGEGAGQAAAPLPAAPEKAPAPTAAQANRPQTSSLASQSGTPRAPTAPEPLLPAPARAPSERPAPAPNAPTPGAPTPGPLSVEITDIRPASVSSAGPPAPGDKTAPSANQPVTPQEKPSPPTSLGALIGQLEQAMERQPPEFDDQLKLRLLYLAAGQDDKAAGPIEGVDPLRAELLSAIVKTVAAARRAINQPASSQAASSRTTALGAVDDLRRLIGQQAGVVIPRIALVTRVSSFGDYEEITPLRFPAGQAVHAYLYTEVANFRNAPTDDGKLKTSLSQTVEVFNAAGECVWQRTAAKLEGLTRTPRHDFFVPFPVQLPAETPPGEYVLKATIEDLIGATTDQRRLTFTVAKK